MIVKLFFLISYALLFSNVVFCQTVYKNGNNERITLLNDSIIRLEFLYPETDCIVNFDRYKNYLELIYFAYTVEFDTLKNQTCNGFYIENGDVYLTSNNAIFLPDPLIVDFIPFSFESKNVQFEFKQKENGLAPFVLKNIEKGCYRLTYTFSNCTFIDMKSLSRIEVRKKGKKLIFGGEKFRIVKTN